MPESLAERVLGALSKHEKMLVTAESCTGGLLSGALTEPAGASKVFDRGFITYSNQSKTDCLNVSASMLETYGAVSEQTAMAMAEGALKNSARSQISVSITGIAGPGGGSSDKPVGLVYIGLAELGKKTRVYRHVFDGGRKCVRQQSVDAALTHILEILGE